MEVRDHAPGGRLEGKMVLPFSSRLEFVQLNTPRRRTSQTVNATVITARTASIAVVIETARRVGQRAKIVVERMVFLHNDDDVVDLCRLPSANAEPEENTKIRLPSQPRPLASFGTSRVS
jgi:hypothetical protein